VGVGAGYDRRKYIAAEGTILEFANGLAEESFWLSAYANGRLDDRSGVNTGIYATWFNSEFDLGGSSRAMGANAAYYRDLTSKLTATAAVSLDGVMREDALIDDYWTAAALVGLRYTF